MSPHNLTFTMIGASLLWFGWFGFNAGSALEASGGSSLAFLNTWLATAAATLSWMLAEWIIKSKPSMLGAASGAVAGLVAITPAAGFVGVGCHWSEENAQGGRLARRVRHPRRGWYHWRAANGCVC
jgi:Amt family ammonium transporter